MRLSAAAIAVSLAWTACSLADPGKPQRFDMGTGFSLRVSEAALAVDGSWRIGFTGVVADSRCPKGEQCVWAGDATVRVWAQQGTEPRQVRELHTASGAAQVVALRGHELRLLGLDPYPVSGKPIAGGDYLATLTLSRSSTLAPER